MTCLVGIRLFPPAPPHTLSSVLIPCVTKPFPGRIKLSSHAKAKTGELCGSGVGSGKEHHGAEKKFPSSRKELTTGIYKDLDPCPA